MRRKWGNTSRLELLYCPNRSTLEKKIKNDLKRLNIHAHFFLRNHEPQNEKEANAKNKKKFDMGRI